METEIMHTTYENILDAQIRLLFRKDSVITLQYGDQTQAIDLEALDMTQLLNLQYILEQNAQRLREQILGGLPIWAVESVWAEWRAVNGQLDAITNYLVCERLG